MTKQLGKQQYSSDVEVVLADTSAALALHYRLRYEVFCLETGFEEASRFPDGEERDEHDGQSAHFILYSKHSGDWLGAARIIFPGRTPLPIEKFCSLSLDRNLVSQTPEFSRLLLRTRTRRRRQGGMLKYAMLRREVGSKDRSNWILLKLFRASCAYGIEHGFAGVTFLITPALTRILRGMNIDLTEIGAPVQHRGLRFPYLIDVKQTYEVINRAVQIADNDPRPYRLFSELYER